jgi:hypothetical protein
MNLDPTKTILGLLTPVVAAASGWLVAAAAKYGIHLDPSGVNALGVAGVTAGAAAMVKLIHDVEGTKGAQQAKAEAGKVLNAVELADPGASGMLEDVIAQGQRALEAKFQELTAQIPQPPAPVTTQADVQAQTVTGAPAPVAPPPAA